MSDKTGALTAAEQALAQAWFAKHWQGAVSCPICKSTAWTTASHVVQMPRLAMDAFTPATTTYPYLPVACNTCAHTIFFNAARMGIAVLQHPPAPTQNALSPAGGLAPIAPPPPKMVG
jgi:ribosomal protein S27E